MIIRRDPAGFLRYRMGVVDMRFEGVSFPLQTQLYSIGIGPGTGVVIFTILNAVLRNRADVLDGLSLTLTRNGGGAPVAGAVLLERTGFLSDDPEADDARFGESIRRDPLAPEGSVPDDIRAHLMRDVGPAALAKGGEMLLTMAFAQSLSRGPLAGVTFPD